MIDAAQLARKPFHAASLEWLALRKYGLKPRTYYENVQAVRRLAVFFGAHTLSDIHVGHLHAYQQARTGNDGSTWIEGDGYKGQGKPWKQKAGPSLVNHEISTLQVLLKTAGLWDRIQPWYKALPLPEPEDPKVLTDEQEMMVYVIASQSPDTELLYRVASIACNTGCSGAELRNLRLGDVRLEERVPGFVVKLETAKNKFRARFVVLNDTALAHVRWCIERAKKAGAGQPDHHLFPWRKGRGPFDVTRPASSSWLRRPMAELQQKTGLPWLTLHCFRHQHITLRLEAGDPIELVAKDVGHSAVTMTRYYTHPRRERQRESVKLIDSRTRLGALYEKKYGKTA